MPCPNELSLQLLRVPGHPLRTASGNYVHIPSIRTTNGMAAACGPPTSTRAKPLLSGPASSVRTTSFGRCNSRSAARHDTCSPQQSQETKFIPYAVRRVRSHFPPICSDVGHGSETEIDAETDDVVGQMVGGIGARTQIGMQVFKAQTHFVAERILYSGSRGPTHASVAGRRE
jgi:hypothetical protein